MGLSCASKKDKRLESEPSPYYHAWWLLPSS